MDGISQSKISFDPPLPFTGMPVQTGFVVEASRTELVLSIAADQTNFSTDALLLSDKNNTLRVLDTEGRAHHVKIKSLSRFGSKLHASLDQKPENIGVVEELLGGLRKNQHITICQHQDVESSDRYTGFEDLEFMPCSFPEVRWDDLDTSVEFLGRKFKYPILITGMTGGVEKGADINRRLAQSAAKHGIPMGIGSQRLALENPAYSHIFSVKQYAPDLFLIGNIGFAQLNRGYGLDACKRAVDMTQADALAIHVNVIQELIQVEGDRDFSGLIEKIAAIARGIDCPVIVKEVGNGIDPETARRLSEAGVAAIDIGGRGGTSWGYIEGLRSQSPIARHVANTFRNWGIPTAHALAAARNHLPHTPLVATGGLRNGLSIAKAVALGATMAGVGLPLLRAALASEEGPSEVLQSYIEELKITMMCTNSANLAELRKHLSIKNPFASALAERLKTPYSQGAETDDI